MNLRRDDGGYAMLAAVVGIAAFAFISFEVLAANRGAIAGLNAEFDNARLAAAADAGMATVVHELALNDRTGRWPIDSRPRSLSFEGIALTVAVEDEKGKVPINAIDEDQARQLFTAAGVTGERLDRLVDAFEDWQDEDDDRRAGGAEAMDYLPQGYRPRNGAFRTVEELIHLRGMDAQLLARVAPALTVFFGARGGFDEDFAQPLALAAMSDVPANSPDVLSREREIGGDQPSLQSTDDLMLIGRPLTVRIDARDGHGGRLRRSAIVELTGSKAQPYWVRYLD